MALRFPERPAESGARILQRRGLTAVVLFVMLAVTACGGNGPYYSYSVSVINNTPGSIAVSYDYDIYLINYEWMENETILPYNSRILEWTAGENGNRIEVECQGKKKLYLVSQFGTVTVELADFLQ